LARLLWLSALLATGSWAGEPGEQPAWRWQRTLTPQVFLAEGLWSDHVHLRPAMHTAGLFYRTGYKSRSAYWRPFDRVVGMPTDHAAYQRYSAVVLCNIDAVSLTPRRLKILESFVRNGGGLVVFGGYWAFAKGAYHGTVLAEMLPVSMPDEPRIARAADGLALKPGEAATWELPFAFAAEPCAFYVQTLVPRQDATVQVTAGEKPAFISGTYGHGRVVACALTANGEAPAGGQAYWDWPDWPRLLGLAVDWATENRPAGAPPGSDGPEPLAADAVLELAITAEPVSAGMLARALAHPGPAVADAFFQLSQDSPDAVQLRDIEQILLPHAKAAWSERLHKLTDPLVTADAGNRGAALRVLGAARGATAFATLQAALADPRARLPAIDGLGWLGDPRAIAPLLTLYERARADSRSTKHPEHDDVPRLLEDNIHIAAHTAVALYHLGEAEGVARLLKVRAQVHLYWRILRNALKRRPLHTDVQGQQRVEWMGKQARRLQQTRAFIDRRFTITVSSQQRALAAAVAGADAEDALVLARACQRDADRVSRELRQALLDAPDGILRRLGQQLPSQARGP
jgi:uncharacterized membrane protein